MIVFTFREILGVILLCLCLVFGLVIVVLYKIAESIENRKNKRLEKRCKESDNRPKENNSSSMVINGKYSENVEYGTRIEIGKMKGGE